MRQKISHFWSPKEILYGLGEKGRREKKKKKKKRPKKVWILIWNLYGKVMIEYRSVCMDISGSISRV